MAPRPDNSGPYTHISEYGNMGTLKTTVDLPDALLREAKACAEAKGVPLRAVIEEGLRSVIQQNRQSRKKFNLRDGSVGGQGLQSDSSWAEIRRKIYEGRGE
jgi:hypothetical protein